MIWPGKIYVSVAWAWGDYEDLLPIFRVPYSPPQWAPEGSEYWAGANRRGEVKRILLDRRSLRAIRKHYRSDIHNPPVGI
jgi:hypothetical protein